MAYFPTSNELVLFAGCSSGYGPCPQGDFWSLDVDRGTWSEITGDDGPAARTNPAMAFHPDPAQLVMFGGRTERGDSADLWLATRDAGRWEWTEITPAGDWPTARSSHDLALAGAGLYLFGGNTANGPMNDFWRLAVRDL